MPEIFGAVAVLGGARSFENPAISALLPGVVPEGLLQKSTALTTGVFQTAMITGPGAGRVAVCGVGGRTLCGDGAVLAGERHFERQH